MSRPARLLAVSSLMLLSACASPNAGSPAHEAAVADFPADADARAQLTRTLAEAREQGKLALVVFGADWCHDSLALANALEDPAIRPLIDTHYRVVFLDAGSPQTGQGRNMDLAAELGVTDITGTPTLIVIGRDGRIRNAGTARAWRNAASRKVGAIAAELAGYADEPR